ncbi:MAG: phosphoenolpyruvate carboxykinase [Pyrinomonadaceae bacterium]|nr:phosphoenolpyruvate carboxykinase [Pyrinomonadaceae bacterium]
MEPNLQKEVVEKGHKNTNFELSNYGINAPAVVYWNLSTDELYDEIKRKNEGVITKDGVVLVDTGEHTGRSANDKFTVKEPSSEDKVWWGAVNKEFSQEKFNAIKDKMMAHIDGKEIYVRDTYAGADEKYQLPVRIINELAWHNLFAQNMFVRQTKSEPFKPEFTVINIPSFKANPETDGTRSETFILVDFGQKLVLIGGTSYAGETKKSVFSLMNYLMPQRGVMSMHCSANVGQKGDVAIFFGLSGTGKTTLSADPERALIGDDEHGWSDDGVFNYEGGCYAKVIKLNPEAEPDIYRTTSMKRTVLENVVFDPETLEIDLDDASRTENTRASYPLESIPNIVESGHAGHPDNIIMLTADAFGVLPPVSKLTPEQAMYHFISGYTAKVAGTEKGVTEPTATFSTCFGAPFMVLHPSVYAELLAEKMNKHNATCWLVNTGWSGGPYGVGERMSIKHTRAMIRAILNGELSKQDTKMDAIFGVHVPVSCPDVPDEVLNPRNTWDDKEAYDAKAAHLANLFNENFKKFEDGVSDEVKNAAPKAS